MERRYYIKDFVQTFHVTEKTLRYYDAVGMLCAQRDQQNYRYYTQEDALRLQCILMCKGMGMSNDEILALLDASHEISLDQMLECKEKQVKEQLKQTNAHLCTIAAIQTRVENDDVTNITEIQNMTFPDSSWKFSTTCFQRIFDKFSYAWIMRVFLIVYAIAAVIIVAMMLVNLLQGKPLH